MTRIRQPKYNWKYKAVFRKNELDVHSVKTNNFLVFLLKYYWWERVKGWPEYL